MIMIVDCLVTGETDDDTRLHSATARLRYGSPEMYTIAFLSL